MRQRSEMVILINEKMNLSNTQQVACLEGKHIDSHVFLIK